MAFLSSFAGVLIAQNKQALAQSMVVDKKSVQLLSSFVRDNTRKHWKTVAGVAFVGTCIYGAIKVRSEILLAREELKFVPTASEVENLSVNASLPEVGAPLDAGMLGQLDSLADLLLEELELEECLEVDTSFADNEKFIDVEQVQAIAECKDDSVREKMEVKYNAEIVRKCRKRVRNDRLPQACKAMVSKLRASFPTPDGTALQQKAMALYLAKEGRKLKMRETQLSVLIPRAVALASVPSDVQVDMRVLMAIEPVKLKYQRMKWGGVIGQKSWLSSLVSALPNIQ